MNLLIETVAAVAGAPAWKTIPSWFIYGDRDLNIPPVALAFMAARAGSKETVVLEGRTSRWFLSRALLPMSSSTPRSRSSSADVWKEVGFALDAHGGLDRWREVQNLSRVPPKGHQAAAVTSSGGGRRAH